MTYLLPVISTTYIDGFVHGRASDFDLKEKSQQIIPFYCHLNNNIMALLPAAPTSTAIL